MYRTHKCGELRREHAGMQVRIAGWVQHKRSFGGVLFVVVGDRYGDVQVTFQPKNKELLENAESLRSQDVVSILGTVVLRPKEARNPKMPTGDIEIIAEELTVLSRSEVPPFVIKDDVNASEELRLRYRYLDLRRRVMQRNLIIRHKAASSTREFLDSEGFVEIEMPYLVRSTPEGARDFWFRVAIGTASSTLYLNHRSFTSKL